MSRVFDDCRLRRLPEQQGSSTEVAAIQTRVISTHTPRQIVSTMTYSPLQFGPRVVIVTMVHGTWARGFLSRRASCDDPWYLPSSKPVQLLANKLATRGIHCIFASPGEWRGRNSLTDRLRCAAIVRRCQRRATTKFPDELRIVIAHSHGGTAALLGIRKMSASHRPDALFTLATPFIVSQKRSATDAERLLQSASSLVWGAVGLGFLLLLNSVALHWMLGSPFVKSHDNLSILVVLAAVLAEIAALRHAQAKTQVWRSRLERHALSGSTSASTPCKLFAIRATGDEATGLLGFGDGVRLINALALSVFRWPARLLKVVEEANVFARVAVLLFWMLVASAGVFVFAALVLDPALPTLALTTAEVSWAVILALGSVVSVIVLGAVSFITFSAVVLLSTFLTRLLSFSYGPEYPFLPNSVWTTSEQSPLGNTLVTSLAVEQQEGLRHGIYNAPECIEAVADHIASLLIG